ncbi:MAG: translation initiation factor IF-3 [Myxococcota bacterium]
MAKPNVRKSTRTQEPRVDRRIRVPEVMVIDSDGSRLGVMTTHEALRRAADQSLNLVEVAPNGQPPVCRILDYGKYKYEQKREAKRRKKNQVVVELKEVKFRPKVDKHDFDFKVRNMERFFSSGDKVKCTIMFRGRELAHPSIGEDLLKRVLGLFEGRVHVEQPPRMEGRSMGAVLSPKPGAFPKKAAPADSTGEPDPTPHRMESAQPSEDRRSA